MLSENVRESAAATRSEVVRAPEGVTRQGGTNSPAGSQSVQASGGFVLQQTFDLPPFSLGGSTSLQQYLQRFEDHCARVYAGSLNEALPLLQSLLVGEIADIFAACGGTDTSYEKLKQRMMRWTSIQESSLDQSARLRFDNVKRRDGEDISLFALRLSSLFEDAYPTEDIQTSDLLRDRLIKNLPGTIGEELKHEIKYNKDIHGKVLRWDHFLTILQCKKHQTNSASSIVFATGNPRTRTPSPPRPSISGNGQGMTASSASYTQRGRDRRTENSERNYREVSPTASPQRLRNRSRGRSPTTCNHCGRRGHIQRTCRRRLGLCFSCGSSTHMIKDCMSRTSRRDSGLDERRSEATRGRNSRFDSRSSGRDMQGRTRSARGGSNRSPSPDMRASSNQPTSPESSEN